MIADKYKHVLGNLLAKEAELSTSLLPHQTRVRDRITQPDQPGLLVVHSMGSGKSFTSIGAQDALGMPATVVLPAALAANYRKEQAKHTKGTPPSTDLETIQRVSRQGHAAANPMLIVDEAHKLRTAGSAGTQAIKNTPFEKRLLMTASPFYNKPHDIAPLINIAAGEEVLPEDQAKFDERYVQRKKIHPSMFGKYILGLTPGEVETLNPRRKQELSKIFNKWTDNYQNTAEGFPDVTTENVEVPLSRKQLALYHALTASQPGWIDRKVLRNLPPSKQEAKQLNAFLTGSRQVMNSTIPYERNPALGVSPKVDKAFEDMKALLEADPTNKAVAYSNFISSGIDPFRKRLQEANIPFGEFTGSMPRKTRDQLVKDYNEGRIRALLLSSAGGEGLDLKGTRLLQVLEPHWNEEKIKQVLGRGARYKSHAALPEEKQNLAVKRYLSVHPHGGILETLGLTSRPTSADQYITNRAAEKQKLIEQFKQVLAESQDL